MIAEAMMVAEMHREGVVEQKDIVLHSKQGNGVALRRRAHERVSKFP